MLCVLGVGWAGAKDVAWGREELLPALSPDTVDSPQCSPSRQPCFFSAAILSCLFSDKLSHGHELQLLPLLCGFPFCAFSLPNLTTDLRGISSLPPDWYPHLCSWSDLLVTLSRPCSNCWNKRNPCYSTSFYKALVELDFVNFVFSLEMLFSLRDAFCDSIASWSSSSWWIFCSSQSLVLAPPCPLAPRKGSLIS